MAPLRKVRREIRRAFHKLPLVGRLVPFPRPERRAAISSRVEAASESLGARIDALAGELATRCDSLAGGFEAQAHAISGLGVCTERHERRLGDQAGRIDSLETGLGQLARTIGADVQRIAERVEFARQETLLEVQRRAGAAAPAPHAARIANEPLVARQRAEGRLRLNLGCGHKPLPDYVNVDARGLPGVDVVAAVDALPFGPGDVAEIHSTHLLEHFPPHVMRDRLLPYWFGLLAPGGRFVAVVPDAAAMMRAYVAGAMSFDALREVTYGSQEYEGNSHHTMFDPATLADLLRQAGFVEVGVTAEGRRNGMCLEFEITGTTPTCTASRS